MKHCPRFLLILLLFCSALGLGGCYSGNIDSFYARPKPADEYLQLQELLDREIAAGSEYAAPTGGAYRQSVHLSDLNGDGTEEAIAFFRDSEQTLKINIYAMDGKDYRPVLSLRGEGTSIGSIEYDDLTGDGQAEVLVTWQIASGMRMLSVYDLRNWSGSILLTADCSEFVVGDMDRNGSPELFVLRQKRSGSYTADMYRFLPGQEATVLSAALASDIVSLNRVYPVTLETGVPALLVESSCDNGDLVTDLLVLQNGALADITLDGAGHSDTRRSYNVYTADIDRDGYPEIPAPNRLYSQTPGQVYWSVSWRSYTQDGRYLVDMTTYHDLEDGWYFVLPRGWEAGLTVRREESIPGEHAVVISQVNVDGSIRDLLSVYTITGENRADRARIAGRFVLAEQDTTIYAARIHSGINEKQVKENFNIIYSDWGSSPI